MPDNIVETTPTISQQKNMPEGISLHKFMGCSQTIFTMTVRTEH